jgi:hypothetical protein
MPQQISSSPSATIGQIPTQWASRKNSGSKNSPLIFIKELFLFLLEFQSQATPISFPGLGLTLRRCQVADQIAPFTYPDLVCFFGNHLKIGISRIDLRVKTSKE